MTNAIEATGLVKRYGEVQALAGLSFSVPEGVVFGLQGQIYGLHGRELEQRIDELLARFGLADAGDRLVRGYSGGMQRRLDIALAPVHRPGVLFMADPPPGLAPGVRAGVGGEFPRLARDEGLTVLLTTHYME